MRLTEALAEYEGIHASGLYVNDTYGRRLAYLRCGELLYQAAKAELPALLAVLEAARLVHREYSAAWDGPALRTLGTALAALEQGSEEGR